MSERIKRNPFEAEKVDKWLETISDMGPFNAVFVDVFKRATEEDTLSREVETLSYSPTMGSKFSIQGVLNETRGTYNLKLNFENDDVSLRVSFAASGLSVVCNFNGNVSVDSATSAHHEICKEEAAFYGLVSEVHKGVAEIKKANRSGGQEISG